MNSLRKSLRLFFSVALAAAVRLVAAVARKWRSGASLDAITPARSSRTSAPGGGASPAVRVRSLTLRGTQFRDAGRYREAEPLFDEALALAEAVFGADSFEVAAVLNQIGMLGKYDGRFDMAEAAYRRALLIVERKASPDHPLSASLFHNLGGLEHARGRFAEGEPLARRSVEIRERALGPDHVDVAADIAALAALLDGQGKYDESEPLYRRALAIFEREYGP